MPPINNNPDEDISRRKTLGTLTPFGILGATSLIGCGGGNSNSSASSTTSSSTTPSWAAIPSTSSSTGYYKNHILN